MHIRSLLAGLLAVGVMTVPVAARVAADEPVDDGALPVAALVNSGIPCASAILVEQTTGKVLFEKDADEQLPPASITKVMTLLLVMEAIDDGRISLDDVVTCSEYASSMGGSQIWLEPGEQMTVDELLRAVAIASANDAAVALAELVAGSEEAFVGRMNERAAELGMTNTSFRNATGLDAEGHLTTARDIMVMSCALLSHPLITQYTTVWMDSLRGGETQLVNTNKLVRFYAGTTGLKTGTTDDAKFCLTASAERDGLSLVAVILGAPTTNDRFGAAKGLLDFGFANYEMRETPAPQPEPDSLPVTGGEKRTVRLTADAPASLLVEKGTGDIEQKQTLAESVAAPVHAGDVLGEAELSCEGILLARYPIVAAEDVGEMTFPIAFRMALRAASSMSRIEFAFSEGDPSPSDLSPEANETPSAMDRIATLFGAFHLG
jgi:D-alanyl-D-alanine carboxypeptidase (penicillin-binding protein 5/6)